MYDDDVRIRPAKPEEAEELADIAWQSKSYWDYPVEVMNIFREMLNIEQDFIERNPSYLIEHEETGEIIGFYALEQRENKWWLEHLWVLPDEIGSGIGGKLFLHACEICETMGADELYIISDPNAEGFYLHMGEERIGEEETAGMPERHVPLLRIKL